MHCCQMWIYPEESKLNDLPEEGRGIALSGENVTMQRPGTWDAERRLRVPEVLNSYVRTSNRNREDRKGGMGGDKS